MTRRLEDIVVKVAKLFSVRSVLVALSLVVLATAVVAFARPLGASAVPGLKVSMGVGCSVSSSNGSSTIKLKLPIKASGIDGVLVTKVQLDVAPPPGFEVDDTPNSATYSNPYQQTVTPGNYTITLDVEGDGGTFKKQRTGSAQVTNTSCRIRTP